MEAFSLLKYWKTNPAAGSGVTAGGPPATTIVTAISESDDDEEPEPETDSGPFFDLEFALPTDDDEEDNNLDENDVVVREDANLVLSPPSETDNVDVFFNDGQIMQINCGNDEAVASADEDATSGKYGTSLLKSATKLRVLMLGLKRSKSQQPEKEKKVNPNVTIIGNNSNNENVEKEKKNDKSGNNKKIFKVKMFKVDDARPLFSLLTRASSSSSSTSSAKPMEEKEKEKEKENDQGSRKEVMKQKYMKLVKPLYVKVGRRESGVHGKQQQGHHEEQRKDRREVGISLKVLMMANRRNNNSSKNWGKCKSAVVHDSVTVNGNIVNSNNNNSGVSKRKDDSLIQLQDGIQGAILHCKRSFNSTASSSSSTDGEGASPLTVLARSASDPTVKVTEEGGKNDVGGAA